MSTSNDTPFSKKNNKKRGVRFTEESIARGSERVARRSDDSLDTTINEDGGPPPRKRQKRPRYDRPNQDELDDIDEFTPDDDREIPSESETLRAKRERRLKQAHDDEEGLDSTHIDQDTSLAAEGITIEPFHMDQENNDGTGYFDGDTYVFRKRNPDEEPDAWLESIQEKEDEMVGSKTAASSKFNDGTSEEEEDENDTSGSKMDNWTEEELYAQIIPFVSDNETIMRAIARYGKIIKQHKGEADTSLAKKALNDLTEAASALLLKGKHDIYQKTRNDLTNLLSVTEASAPDTINEQQKPVVQWEYQGSQDNQIHGPYSTQQMQGWIQQGYFVGPSAVMIRSIQVEHKQNGTTKDDLLSDLLEDDNDEEDAKPASSTIVRGEWTKSDQVDFSKYA